MTDDGSRRGTPRLSGPRRAVVVGGGVAGLAAARTLAGRGVDVTLLEARDRVGGCIRTVEFAGERLDVGAEAVHTAAPEPQRLLVEAGLQERQVAPRSAVTWVAARGGLRPLPDGVGPAGPSRIGPLVRAGLLSPGGLARAALEPLVPRGRTSTDASVGDVLARRFGSQVVDRVVDPLLGGLHAGDVGRLSVRSATPALTALLDAHRSVVLAGRRRTGPPGGLATLRGGLGALPEAMAEQLVGDVRTRQRVVAVVATDAGGPRYRVETADGAHHAADLVVVALPAAPAAATLAALDPSLAVLLRELRTSSVAVVLLAYPPSRRALPALEGTGVLVPSGAGRLLKAATFLTSKWPHLADASHVLVRASAGRAGDRRHVDLDDGTLVERLSAELAATAGLTGPVEAAVVTRWDDAMPQLEVGHGHRMATIRGRLASHRGVALAGAAYDGVGVAAALRSGVHAATAALDDVTGVT